MLTEFRSIDWQSLTFIGERHEFQLRIPGPEAPGVLTRILNNMEETEFDIAGHFVADVAVVGEPGRQPDGSMTIALEALTIAQD